MKNLQKTNFYVLRIITSLNVVLGLQCLPPVPFSSSGRAHKICLLESSQIFLQKIVQSHELAILSHAVWLLGKEYEEI